MDNDQVNNMLSDQQEEGSKLNQDLTRSRSEYTFLEQQYQDILKQAMMNKAQLAAANAEQDRLKQPKRTSDAQASCQILTVRDIQELQTQTLNLEKTLESERARARDSYQQFAQKEQEMRASLTMKDEESRSTKDSTVRRLEKDLERKSEEVRERESELELV